MEERIRILEERVSLIEERERLTNDRVSKLEGVRDEFYSMKTSITKMEMIDMNIFEKLDKIEASIKTHKDNFEEHNAEEMKKYSSIDSRLLKIERVMYAGIAVVFVLELLEKFHLVKFGG